jgi:hypothetical protein
MSGRTLASKTVLICSIGITANPLFSGVKMHFREGLPVVDGVYVNGHGPYRFLVDTGTNINLIEPRLARTIGMNATFQDEVASPAGMTRLPGSDGNEIELGPVKAHEQRFAFSGAVHSLLPDVQGVLGQWFLSGFDYMLDLRGKRLEFGKQDLNGRRAPLRMRNGRTAVSTSLGDLVLDSGAVRLVLFGVDPDRDRGDQGYLQTVGGPQIVGLVFSRLTIEGRHIWNGNAVAIPSRTEPGVAGLMPLRLFKTIFVCNSEGYVIFE